MILSWMVFTCGILEMRLRSKIGSKENRVIKYKMVAYAQVLNGNGEIRSAARHTKAFAK